MSRLTILKGLLWLWVAWHLGFGLLSTFAPALGASLVGCTATGGWDDELVAMSTQYGMLMLLLALVYAIIAIEPLRYLGLLWVAVAEQLLGIGYAGYLHVAFGQLTPGQLLIQTGINLTIVVLFLQLRHGLRTVRPRPAD